LHKHYNNNEVLADEDFKNKYAVVTGTVEEIRKDFMDNMVLDLKTGDMFMNMNIELKESQKRKAMHLKKGNKVKVFVKIKGLVISMVQCDEGVIL